MQEKKKGTWVDVVKTLFWALILAVVFRSFLFEPYHIPSGSMLPNLLIGDFVIVSKYSYGYSNHSFPLSPELFDGRIWYTSPQRGDIAVFKVPGKGFGKDVYIKRIIGLPGDTVQMINGKLHINGALQETYPAGEFHDLDRDYKIPQQIEVLENGVEHKMLDEVEDSIADETNIEVVPEGHFFMMGDNRDNSNDSRFESPGAIPAEHLIGRAEMVLFSSRGMIWNPVKWRYDRFFEKLYN